MRIGGHGEDRDMRSVGGHEVRGTWEDRDRGHGDRGHGDRGRGDRGHGDGGHGDKGHGGIRGHGENMGTWVG